MPGYIELHPLPIATSNAADSRFGAVIFETFLQEGSQCTNRQGHHGEEDRAKDPDGQQGGGGMLIKAP